MESMRIPFKVQVPAAAPDGFKHPEVIAAIEMQIAADRNILRGMDQVTGMSQKDTSLWSNLTALDTILVQNHRRFHCKAWENIAAGQLVNIFLSAGIPQARLADNAPAKLYKARGYATGAVATGNYGEFIIGSGLIPGFTGLAINTDLWLGTTGNYVTSAPAVTGTLIQPVGFGLETEVAFIDISLSTSIAP